MVGAVGGRRKQVVSMTQNATSARLGARLDVRGLLRALEDGWLAYLPAVRALDERQTQAYLAAQGEERLRDLLAEATAWAEETVGAVAALRHGGAEAPALESHDDAVFAAQAIARLSLYTTAEVERRFTQAHMALAQLLAVLPEDALAQPNVYDWLETTIVARFNTRRPPTMPTEPQLARSR